MFHVLFFQLLSLSEIHYKNLGKTHPHTSALECVLNRDSLSVEGH